MSIIDWAPTAVQAAPHQAMTMSVFINTGVDTSPVAPPLPVASVDADTSMTPPPVSVDAGTFMMPLSTADAGTQTPLPQQALVNAGTSMTPPQGPVDAGTSMTPPLMLVDAGTSMDPPPVSVDASTSMDPTPVSVDAGTSMDPPPVSVDAGTFMVPISTADAGTQTPSPEPPPVSVSTGTHTSPTPALKEAGTCTSPARTPSPKLWQEAQAWLEPASAPVATHAAAPPAGQQSQRPWGYEFSPAGSWFCGGDPGETLLADELAPAESAAPTSAAFSFRFGESRNAPVGAAPSAGFFPQFPRLPMGSELMGENSRFLWGEQRRQESAGRSAAAPSARAYPRLEFQTREEQQQQEVAGLEPVAAAEAAGGSAPSPVEPGQQGSSSGRGHPAPAVMVGGRRIPQPKRRSGKKEA